MDVWFERLAAAQASWAELTRPLREDGFVVIRGPVEPAALSRLAAAYDAAVASAPREDVSISVSTRVHDFVNRGPAFDALYLHDPLLAACCCVIGRPFKLSSVLARTLEPGAPAQELHVDVRRGSADWPLLGFILMVDDFTADNGATRFVPGTHRRAEAPADVMAEVTADHRTSSSPAAPPAR
jgi:hypothetical protein